MERQQQYYCLTCQQSFPTNDSPFCPQCGEELVLNISNRQADRDQSTPATPGPVDDVFLPRPTMPALPLLALVFPRTATERARSPSADRRNSLPTADAPPQQIPSPSTSTPLPSSTTPPFTRYHPRPPSPLLSSRPENSVSLEFPPDFNSEEGEASFFVLSPTVSINFDVRGENDQVYSHTVHIRLPPLVVSPTTMERLRTLSQTDLRAFFRFIYTSMDGSPLFQDDRAHQTAAEVIRNLKTFPVCDDDRKVESECPICQQDWEDGEEATLLPCSHFFHKPCIAPWLHTSNTCPICRVRLPSELDVANEKTQQEQQEQRTPDRAETPTRREERD